MTPVSRTLFAAGCEMDTKKTDQIKVGTIITVVSARRNSRGQLRVEYGPLEIHWSKFDGGWVSVETSAGEIAWKIHKDVDSSDDEDSGEDELQQNEEKEDQCDREANVLPEESKPSHGFEVDSETLRPILTSNRNKMDLSFGATLPHLSTFALAGVSPLSVSDVMHSSSGEVKDVFTGFIGSGIVEQIEQVSPLWPQRILMGEEDPMLDCPLQDFVSMMQVRKTAAPTLRCHFMLASVRLFDKSIPHPLLSWRCWVPRTRFMSRARGHSRQFQMASLPSRRTRSVRMAAIRNTSPKKV